MRIPRFDYGPEGLEACVRASKFPWLGANITDKSSGIDAYRIFHVLANSTSGAPPVNLKIGVFGICTPSTPYLSFPGPTVSFGPIISTAKDVVTRLKEIEKADVVIALTHLPLSEDINLAHAVPGIHVILGGHDHVPFNQLEDQTLVFKTGQNAQWLGIVDLDIDVTVSESTSAPTEAEHKGQNPAPTAVRQVRVVPSWRMVASRAGVAPHPVVREIIAKYRAEKEAKEAEERAKAMADPSSALATLPNDVVIVRVDSQGSGLSTKTDDVRRKEMAFPCLVADAMRELAGREDFGLGVRFTRDEKGDIENEQAADLGVINGGFVRGDKNYSPGVTLTVADIRRELPFPKQAVILKISGQALREALEQMLTGAPVASGSFPHLSRHGELVYDVTKPPMSRISSFKIKGQDVQADQTYRVAVSIFMAGGGDGCVAWTQGHPELPASERKAVQERALSRGRSSPKASDIAHLPPAACAQVPTISELVLRYLFALGRSGASCPCTSPPCEAVSDFCLPEFSPTSLSGAAPNRVRLQAGQSFTAQR